ncbi:MAG: relaxase domain-containing protein [Gemmataceae bacterium]|nr:relaxase domain-containing protein [Gemmataceae bacterium]
MHVTHRTTRPNQQDHLPDKSLHSHVVVFNATYDAEERKFKAAQIGQIKKDVPFYEAAYQNRLASNLREMGCGIRRKDKAFEIEGVNEALCKKFSRRTETVELAKRTIEGKYGVIFGLEAKAKLGATTRLYKVDIREDHLARYWVCRLTEKEKELLASLKGRLSYGMKQ